MVAFRRVLLTFGREDVLARGLDPVPPASEAVREGSRRRGPPRPLGYGHLQGHATVPDHDGVRVQDGAENRRGLRADV